MFTAEDRLKRLQDDLMGTERKLLQATKDLKRMGDIPDKDDIKVQIRQRMAKKMQLVGNTSPSFFFFTHTYTHLVCVNKE